MGAEKKGNKDRQSHLSLTMEGNTCLYISFPHTPQANIICLSGKS